MQENEPPRPLKTIVDLPLLLSSQLSTLQYVAGVSTESVAVRLDTLLSGGLHHADVLIQSASAQHRCISAIDFTQNHQSTISQLGVVELVDQYTEKYLVAHAILDGRCYTSHTQSITKTTSFVFDHPRSGMVWCLSVCMSVRR